MKKNIERADYLRLVGVFANHPDFGTETDRWNLITLAFGRIAGGERATGNPNLAGHARNAAVALVDRLLNFYRLGERQSLFFVMDVLRACAGDDQQAGIDRLIGLLDGQGAASRPSHPATTARQTDVLHLSDLHFGSPDDARRLHGRLAEDLKRGLACTRLDAMIVSGDMTMVGAEDEYAAARTYIENKVRDEPLYRERFRLFSDALYEPITGTAHPLDYAEQFRFHQWPNLRLLVLGLNSAWEIDHHHDKDRAAVHPLAIANALDALRARSDWEGCLKLGVWHHPLTSDEPSRITDRGFVERLAAAGFRLRLHGHMAVATARPARNAAALSPADLIHQNLTKHPPARRLLLLVDQWEELYTHRHLPPGLVDRPVQEHFADALLEATAAAPLSLVQTLRADFYHHLLDHRAWPTRCAGPGTLT